MTLEDFFTLSEMKSGLATLARVEELIGMMQNQDIVLSNAGDAPRQWSTVASTIAATENKDCLHHFVQLNGLCFLNHWLQEALKCSSEISNNNIEELINALLGSFERLPLDMEKSTLSGIWSTIAQLFCHKSIHIKERARILSEKWNQAATSDLLHQTEEDAQNDQPKPSADAQTTAGISPCKEDVKEGCCGAEPTGTESHYSNVTRCTNSLDTDNNIEIPTSNQITATSSSLADSNAMPGDMNSLGSSLITNSCQENCSFTEESSIRREVGMASSTCNLSVSRKREHDNQCDASALKDEDGGKMEVEANIAEVCTGKHHGSSNVPSSGLSTSLPVTEPTLPSNLEPKEIKPSISETVEPQPMSMDIDCGLLKCSSTQRELSPEVNAVKSPRDLSSTECKLKTMDDSETSVHRKEARESATYVELGDSETNLKLSKGVDIISPCKVQKFGEVNVADEVDHMSEVGLECGEIDALEVARQVAIEVEREVVEYREPFCKSSPETSSGKSTCVLSPDFVEDMPDQQVIEQLNSNIPPNRKDLSCGVSSPTGDSLRLPEEIDINPGHSEHGMELPESGTVGQESDCKIDRRKCDFDLNEDISGEEFDCLVNHVPNDTVNLSVPIAVSASKGAPVLPVASLQFQGELGWKGSTATSAFRPASPRRTSGSEKAYSSQKQKTNLLQFDLNVAEREDDVVVDPTSAKQMPISSVFPSGESSEVGSRRAERLKLDLNRLGDEDMLPNPPTHWMLHRRNGDQSLSPASSSTSRQPPLRDFDLNDHPSFFGAGGSHNLSTMSSKAYGTYGNSKHDPDIMIMGSRMAERGNYVNGVQTSFLRNGSGMESATPLLPYAYKPPSAYGYNRLPEGSSMPFTPALYGQGSFPYMVDSRGTTLMPQIMGSAGINGAHLVTPLPYITGVTSVPSSNGIGFSQSSLDLNYGMVSGPSGQSGSREIGGSMQSFMPGHYGLVEAQATGSSQPVFSGMTLKRKEPDCGWEPYAFVTNR